MIDKIKKFIDKIPTLFVGNSCDLNNLSDGDLSNLLAYRLENNLYKDIKIEKSDTNIIGNKFNEYHITITLKEYKFKLKCNLFFKWHPPAKWSDLEKMPKEIRVGNKILIIHIISMISSKNSAPSVWRRIVIDLHKIESEIRRSILKNKNLLIRVKEIV